MNIRLTAPLGISLLLVATLGSGCSRSNGMPTKPATAGTAQQLVNTSWKTSGGVLTFRPNSVVEFVPKPGGRLPAPKGALRGNYQVAQGILRASIANTMPFVGTWDGKTLVIDKEVCQQVKK